MRDVAALVAVAAALAGCADNQAVGPSPVPKFVSVSAIQGNGLTARVMLDVAGLDSVRIGYSSPGDGAWKTPAQTVQGQFMSRLVLGMRPDARYVFRPEGWYHDIPVFGDTVSFRTDTLPGSLGTFRLQITGTPSPGMTMIPAHLGASGYLVVFDSAGTIRWYLETTAFPGQRAVDVKQLPNGHLLAYFGDTRGWDPVEGRFYEFDLEGRVVRTLAAPAPLYTDNHDIVVDFADTTPVAATLVGYDIRVTDVRPFGGADSVALAGHQIIRQRFDGTTEFVWNAWDHFSLLDWIEEPQVFKQWSAADFDHPNSIVRDADGNYIVSWRNLGAVTKIDAQTGALLWQLGGRNNQFTFVGDAFGLFSGQHSVKAIGHDNYLLYDNGLRHSPPETRIAEYHLDLKAMTATLVWEYRHTPAIFTQFVGWVQRLRSGNTFIAWADAGILQEVTPGKQTVWQADVKVAGVQTTFYRAIRLASLYATDTP